MEAEEGGTVFMEEEDDDQQKEIWEKRKGDTWEEDRI